MIKITEAYQKNESPIPLQLKIIYWGPGESGKTTNFLTLNEAYKKFKVSKGYQLETSTHRTIWSDDVRFCIPYPILNRTYHLYIHLGTTTGQERFLHTRENIVSGADGIIFVADSDPDKMVQNMRSFRELQVFLNKWHTPYLIQLNKRDLANAIDIDVFKELLQLPEEEYDFEGHKTVYPSVALEKRDAVDIFVDILSKVMYQKISNCA